MSIDSTGLHDGAARPWYRFGIVWLVTGIPALTVVAGLTTVFLAGHNADAIVSDDFRKEGIAINRDPARDEAAAELGVGARVSVDAGTVSVDLHAGRAEPPRRLVAILSHATRAPLDRMVTLERGADGTYSIALPDLARGHWYLELTPPDRTWRLTADFVDRLPSRELRPSARRPAES
jgi:hypothetical protein